MPFRAFYIGYAINWLRQVIVRKPRPATSIPKGNPMPASLDWIFTRRSIRRFHANPVDDEQVESLLKAAMAAPSANNARPWHFIVIRDRQILDRIAEVHPYAKMCYEATLVIAVCGDPTVSRLYWPQDCSAATQNILLAGTAMGLGTVWLGVHPRLERKEPLSALLGVPSGVELLSLVAVGHPAEKKKSRTQYDPSRVHLERW